MPHKESKTDVSMDLEFGRAMLNLERKVRGFLQILCRSLCRLTAICVRSGGMLPDLK